MNEIQCEDTPFYQHMKEVLNGSERQVEILENLQLIYNDRSLDVWRFEGLSPRFYSHNFQLEKSGKLAPSYKIYFDETPQGHHYWMNVNNLYESLVKSND